jgi:hypothetical protein
MKKHINGQGLPEPEASAEGCGKPVLGTGPSFSFEELSVLNKEVGLRVNSILREFREQLGDYGTLIITCKDLPAGKFIAVSAAIDKSALRDSVSAEAVRSKEVAILDSLDTAVLDKEQVKVTPSNE